MAVSNGTIIEKMMKELQQAKQQSTNQETMKQHLSHVRLLCDLILQGEAPTTNKSEVSEAEMIAMLGTAQQNQPKQMKEQQQFGKQSIDHDEANGNSIFDF